MAASTADRTDLLQALVQYVNPPVAASTIIYSGTCVCVDSSGNLNLAAATSGFLFLGLSDQHVDNSAGIAGAKSCRVTPRGLIRYITLDAVSPATSWIGQPVYFTDDHTVALSGSNSIKCGIVVDVPLVAAAGRVTVDVGGF